MEKDKELGGGRPGGGGWGVFCETLLPREEIVKWGGGQKKLLEVIFKRGERNS